MAVPTGVIGRTAKVFVNTGANTLSPATSVIDVSSGVPSQSIQTGDVMFLFFTFSQSASLGTLTPPAGWILVASVSGTAANMSVFIYMKARESGETSYSWTLGSGATPNARFAWVRDAVVTDYQSSTFHIRGDSGFGSSTTNIAASLTTLEDDMTAYAFSFDKSNPNGVARTESQHSVSNFTKVATWANDTATEGWTSTAVMETVLVGYKQMPTAGATGSATVTYPYANGTNGWSGIIALKPAESLETPPTGVIETAFIPNFLDTKLTVGASVTQGSTFKIRVGLEPTLTGAVDFTGAISINNLATATATGLTAGTKYYVSFLIDDVLQTDYQLSGSTTGYGPGTYKALAGSCQVTGSNHASLAAMADEEALFLAHMGDIHYEDADNASDWLQGMRSSMTAANQIELMKNTPMSYIWDNHDRIIIDTLNTGTTDPETVDLYREMAGTEWSAEDAMYSTWVTGGVRFIHTDPWTLRDDPDLVSEPRNMFGATQKAWIKATMLASTEAMIVWFCSFPNHNAQNGRWNSFQDEVDEMGAWATANPFVKHRLIMIGGDSHDLRADSGTRTVGLVGDGFPTHNFIGVPTLNVSGFDQGSDTLWDTGNWDIAQAVTGAGSGSYSRLTWTYSQYPDTVDMLWEAIDGSDGTVLASYRRLGSLPKVKVFQGGGFVDTPSVIGFKVADARELIQASMHFIVSRPNEFNTGWERTGVTLTDYSTPSTILTDQTLDSRNILTDITVSADVIVTRSMINGHIYADGVGYSLLLEDCEIDASTFDGAAVGFQNVTIRRCNIYGGANSVIGSSNIIIEDSILHDQYLAPGSGAHQNGFLSNGGSNVVIHNCVIHANQPDNGSGGGVSTNLSLFGDFAPIADVTIEGCYFPATPGAYSVSLGYNPGWPEEGKEFGDNPTNVIFRNNVFERGDSGNGGVFGPVTSFLDDNGNIFENNTWEDGELITLTGATGIYHSIFGANPHEAQTVGTDSIDVTVATAFYTFSGASVGWTCVGARVYVPPFITRPESLVVKAWAGTETPDLAGAATKSGVITNPVVGWNEVLWDSPISMTPSSPVWIGYNTGDDRYFYSTVANSPRQSLTTPYLYRADTSDFSARSRVCAEGGATTNSILGFGCDILVDDGVE